MDLPGIYTKYRNEIFQYAIIKSDAKPSSIEELTILHLHAYLGMRGYIKGLGAMSAEERIVAYENGLGAMSAEERMAAGKKDMRMGSGLCRPRRGWRRVKREPPMTKWASNGRRSMLSSKDAWKCRRRNPATYLATESVGQWTC
jgi:hypothetical protein